MICCLNLLPPAVFHRRPIYCSKPPSPRPKLPSSQQDQPDPSSSHSHPNRFEALTFKFQFQSFMMLGHSRSNSKSDEEQSVQMEGTQRGKEKAKRKRPPMKKRSEVWNHFILLENNPNKCRCNYCGKEYQCHSRFDRITNMTRHLKGCDTYKTFREQQRGSQQNLTSEGGEENASNLVLGKGWNQDAYRRALTKMIIMGELPLSFVDNK